jgi:molecular chaperone DnaK (HSP70)
MYKKSAEDVTVDFLRELWEYTKQELRLQLCDNFMAKYSIKVVLTVSAVWTPETANLTRELAIRAGIQAEQLNLVQEPEAAAVAVAEVSSGS